MITPFSWLSNSSFYGLRRILLEDVHPILLSVFPVGVFADAGIATGVLVAENALSDSESILEARDLRTFAVDELSDLIESDSVAKWIPISVLKHSPEMVINLDWSPLYDSAITKIEINSIVLDELAYVDRGCDTANNQKYTGFVQESGKNSKKLILGDDFGRYDFEWSGVFLYYLPEQMTSEKATARPGEPARFEVPEKLVVYRFLDRNRRFTAILDTEQFYSLGSTYVVSRKSSHTVSLKYLLALLNSDLVGFYNQGLFSGVKITRSEMLRLPIRRIDFTTPAAERERLARTIIAAYANGDHAGVLHRVGAVMGADQTDVVHDVLAHLAQRMIALNQRKQAEVGRFLGWVENALTPPAPSPTRSAPGEEEQESPSPLVGEGFRVRGLIDTLTGKTIIQGYLGDYQKGEGELPWEDFRYRLHQNRNRFGVSLADVEGEIEREYEASLETLVPIKHDLARTDALIDKIVYRLYGLTDEEIELIERPQYEQALADAKAQVVADEKIDDDEKIEKIAEGILPAARRFFERVEPHEVEALLDAELPHWRDLPPDAPVFLVTGDYNLRSLPDHMDFSSSVIPYTKAVEVVLGKRIFEPFRASHRPADCHNQFLREFVEGSRYLTLGAIMIILSSSRETALRRFIGRIIRDVDGLATTLNDDTMRDVRNRAAHDEVLARDEAHQARAWALGILGRV